MQIRVSTLVLALTMALAGCRTTSAPQAAAGEGPAAPAAPAATSESGNPSSSSTRAVPAVDGWQLDWARDAVFYEIFVRSFQDSDGDGIGDFRGLVSRLDQLNDGDPTTTSDLGIDALWLMPVFASPSYHGYDVVDYERINPEYGTEADFDHFLAEAHRRGIRVILDLVMNHSSREHPWFADSARGPASPRRDWYVWRADDPRWTQPWGGNNTTWHPLGGAFYYGVFWGGMPDLNFAHPPVREEMKRLASLWLARGVDGFRLDATRHLFANGPGEGQNDQPETHAFLRELADHVRASHPEALLVGENWTSTAAIAQYYGATTVLPEGDELPLSFNFPLASALVRAARDGVAAPVLEVFAAMAEHYPPGVMDAPFLTNHDMIRVATQLGGDRPALAQAAAMLLTLPGTPFLYYGEEIGLENGPGGDDRQKRTPMPWDASPSGGFTTAAAPWFPFAPGQVAANVATERSRPGSLLAVYRDLLAIRRAEVAVRRGRLRPLTELAATKPQLLAWELAHGIERRLVVHNLGTEVVALPWNESVRVVYALGEVTAPNGEVVLPGRSSALLAPAGPSAGAKP